MEAAQKIKYFEYFLEKLYSSMGENNDLSVVKTQKLLYFLCNSYSENENYPLFDVFDKFYALPYGHVESDVYQAIKDNQISNFEITRFGMTPKSILRTVVPADEQTVVIDLCYQNLISTNLFKKSSSYLVDLSHCHETWIKNYRLARLDNKLSHPIVRDELNTEMKFFSL